MQLSTPVPQRAATPMDGSIGRIVSVTGSRAIVLLDNHHDVAMRGPPHRPEIGTLLGIDTSSTIALAIVSALSVPVPAQRDGEAELWIAELGLVGELRKGRDGRPQDFNRGVSNYPALGHRVRVASKDELKLAFCGDMRHSVRVGCIRQDDTIPAMIRVDELLGKHFAVLGTTGTGKSCTTALILRAILEKNPAAHLVLLDPHNEYATAFTEWAEVLSPRNMQLPFWLLTFEELTEVLIGHPADRKSEVEILQELIPIAKARYSTGRGKEAQALRARMLDVGRYTVDTPVPYRLSDLISLIEERMGKLENKRDLAPYRNLKTRVETLSIDPRYAFMFGSLTVNDDMAHVLGRVFRVPVNNKPITVLELTGLPAEIVNVVVAVLCRMTFDFALWSEGKIPVTLVCEEAHRYVPANASLGFEPCKRAIAKIAKEGRKYGASLCIVTQRPAEIDPTILSQCNTVFALRMSNDRDQQIVSSAISDTGSGLLEFLSALGQREAIAFGDGVTLPVRIRFDELPRHAMPRSSTARFSEMWQKSMGDELFLEQIVEKWRLSASGAGSGHENGQQAGGSADASELANGFSSGPGQPDGYDLPPQRQPSDAAHGSAGHDEEPDELASQRAGQAHMHPQQAAGSLARPGNGATSNTWREPSRREPGSATGSHATQGQSSSALRSLRERLVQRTPPR